MKKRKLRNLRFSILLLVIMSLILVGIIIKQDNRPKPKITLFIEEDHLFMTDGKVFIHSPSCKNHKL